MLRIMYIISPLIEKNLTQPNPIQPNPQLCVSMIDPKIYTVYQY